MGCAQVILYSFPAVCWLYGAGFIFSSFVSVVFWGASAQQLYESLRKHSTVVRPMGLQVRGGSCCCRLHGSTCCGPCCCGRDRRAKQQCLLAGRTRRRSR